MARRRRSPGRRAQVEEPCVRSATQQLWRCTQAAQQGWRVFWGMFMRKLTSGEGSLNLLALLLMRRPRALIVAGCSPISVKLQAAGSPARWPMTGGTRHPPMQGPQDSSAAWHGCVSAGMRHMGMCAYVLVIQSFAVMSRARSVSGCSERQTLTPAAGPPRPAPPADAHLSP